MKKWLTMLLIPVLLFSLWGCQPKTAPQSAPVTTMPAESEPEIPAGPSVGVCIPDNDPRWKTDVAVMTRELQSRNYNIIVEYAAGDPGKQARQMEKLIEAKVLCLIVAPVDSMALVEAEKMAKEAGIPIIAYDRLLMDTQAVDAFVTFDYEKMGQEMGSYIVEQKQLKTAATENRSYTVEFYMGSADDHSALLLHTGLMSVLQPYLDAGVLVCASGRTSFADTYVLQASAIKAKEKLSNCLSLSYGEGRPDILCTGSDEMAVACAEILDTMGFSGSNRPLIVSQGGSVVGVRAVLSLRIDMTVYKDNRELASNAVRIAGDLIAGQTPEYNETQRFHNHMIPVPAWVCRSFPVDSLSCWAQLVETGIYTESELTE